MFRFDFRDKSLIPPILGTDNADYLERLCPVLEREKIHPSGVVRLRDAAFCEERGIVQLSSLSEHTALLENEDYLRLGHRFGMDGDVIRNGLAAFPTCTAVEYGQKVLLLGKTDKGDKAMEEFLNDLIGKRMEQVYQENDGEQYDPFNEELELKVQKVIRKLPPKQGKVIFDYMTETSNNNSDLNEFYYRMGLRDG